ncbi:MAG: TetR/AcrR family transcriptional regulator [Clostridiales bacterium]|nr:TetR/AcrR family transcriptional regulator [Clostridiales bacterium]
MANDTKTKIINAALKLFSEKGYNGTNVRELSNELGLVKSALYKHYESKEAVWEALADSMEAYYSERFGSENNLPPIPDSTDELFNMTVNMVTFTVNDEKIRMTRKLLMTEQFRDRRASDLATKHFLMGTRQIFRHIFAGMIEKGLLKNDDPDMLALEYTAPITVLIHLCDREPKNIPEALSQIEAFCKHFIKTHKAD